MKAAGEAVAAEEQEVEAAGAVVEAVEVAEEQVVAVAVVCRQTRRWAAWGRLVDMGGLLGVMGHLRRSLTGSRLTGS